MTDVNKEIGRIIKARREAKGWKLEDLASKLDITISGLSKIESGTQRMYSEMLIKLSEAFNMSLDDLLNRGVPSNGDPKLINEANPNRISKDLLYVIENYENAKEEEFSNHDMGSHIRNKLKNTVFHEAGLSPDIYQVVGSVGQGQWAEVPWLSIFMRDITITATRGYYIVFLFTSDGTGVYLSLNQGWTYFKEKYGTKKGRTMIQRTATLMKSRLHMIPEQLQLDKINLKGRGPLAKGYELGHICGAYYDLNDFPTSEKIIDDLLKLLLVYSEINTIKGDRSIEELNDFLLLEEDEIFLENAESEEKFQRNLQEGIDNNLVLSEDEKHPRRPPIKSQEGKEVYGRRISVALSALKEAGYQCVINPAHKSFISKATQKQYVEAHHIVPMSRQDDFIYDLDQTANIAALCPICHRLIHHGTDDQREEVLRKLFVERRDRLEKIGIEITFSSLKKMYDFEDIT